jgi:hypothetical protein
MRILSLVFSFLLTVSLAAVALTYLEGRIGQHRIYVQDEWLSSPDQTSYPDTAWIAMGDPDTLPPALVR